MPDPGDAATRRTYDLVASSYARMLPDLTVEAPLDRAVLNAFAENVTPGGTVAEIGCGTGRVAAHLARELQIVGLDLSPGMVAVARSAHPQLALAVAHAGELPFRSGALAGLVAWYSLIHLASERLPSVMDEVARVTRAEAPVLVAFQSGDGERVDRATSYGHPAPLTSYRHRVADVSDALTGAGFELHATVRREPLRAHESTPQTFLLATRRSAP